MVEIMILHLICTTKEIPIEGTGSAELTDVKMYLSHQL
jgi:hypothetical protein